MKRVLSWFQEVKCFFCKPAPLPAIGSPLDLQKAYQHFGKVAELGNKGPPFARKAWQGPSEILSLLGGRDGSHSRRKRVREGHRGEMWGTRASLSPWEGGFHFSLLFSGIQISPTHFVLFHLRGFVLRHQLRHFLTLPTWRSVLESHSLLLPLLCEQSQRRRNIGVFLCLFL